MLYTIEAIFGLHMLLEIGPKPVYLTALCPCKRCQTELQHCPLTLWSFPILVHAVNLSVTVLQAY